MRRALAVLLGVALMVTLQPSSAQAYFYPKTGDLFYNGANFADSLFNWGTSPGPFNAQDPGYEHDLAIHKAYVSGCTTYTDLPYGYNDCPTAGQAEKGDWWVFSFGSFHALYINPSTMYYGSWNLTREYASSSTITLQGQEVARTYCWFDDIYCMGSIQTSSNLVSGTFGNGVQFLKNWSR